MSTRARYRLGGLGNEQLLAALKRLIQQENGLTADLLAHLAELDERKLYVELGFPSLFAYCTESLGLSESSAGRRITAARVGRRFPDVFAAVARGELNLSTLCALNPYLNQENAPELFGACSNEMRHRYGVHFTADGEFRELLDAARALASHRLPAGSWQHRGADEAGAEGFRWARQAPRSISRSFKMQRSDALRLDGNRPAVERVSRVGAALGKRTW